MRSGPGAARTILLFHIISARPSKQPLMVRTFLKVCMELGSYFLFLQEEIKDIIIIKGDFVGGYPGPRSLLYRQGTCAGPAGAPRLTWLVRASFCLLHRATHLRQPDERKGSALYYLQISCRVSLCTTLFLYYSPGAQRQRSLLLQIGCRVSLLTTLFLYSSCTTHRERKGSALYYYIIIRKRVSLFTSLFTTHRKRNDTSTP